MEDTDAKITSALCVTSPPAGGAGCGLWDRNTVHVRCQVRGQKSHSS